MRENILLALFLTICSVTDILKKQIYMKVIIPFFSLGLALFFIKSDLSVIEELTGILLGVLLLILARLSSERIGYGDALMVMVSGAYLGIFLNIKLLMWALFISALFSLLLLILKKAGRYTQIPFAPFLLISYFLMTFI